MPLGCIFHERSSGKNLNGFPLMRFQYDLVVPGLLITVAAEVVGLLAKGRLRFVAVGLALVSGPFWALAAIGLGMSAHMFR